VSDGLKRARKWLGSTSNRTFIVWPLVLLGAEALVQRGVPRIDAWGLPVMAWGYLQYRLVGNYRNREGGGGPGQKVPPDRILDVGPYRFVRNPMYLGHLIFLAGLALTLGSWIALAVLVAHGFWFHRHVRVDEERLAALFGDAYRDYCRRVKRWIPGIL
jgi:protein-S-isoprenylcysteine O-methyltransferase Ste14